MAGQLHSRLWQARSSFASASIVDASITIVTGADQSHADSLFQLLESIQRHESKATVHVHDLGLSMESKLTLANMAEKNPSIRIEAFRFDLYPSYFDIRVSAGEYAWKPVIIAIELSRLATRFLIWLDAGDVVNGPLRNVRRAIAKSGLWSPESGGEVRDWTDDQLMIRLGLSARQRSRRNLSGSIVGIDSRSGRAKFITELWALGAQSKDWIAPPGSNRENHRQDQALLSGLIAAVGLRPFPQQRLELGIHRDIDEFQDL
jgi:hypothetical protein